MFYPLLREINVVLKRYNLAIRNTDRNIVGYYLQKYDNAVFLESKKGVYDIPLEKCVSQFYFSYHPKGWHPYKASIMEYVTKEKGSYKNSILNKYYEKFRPKNLSEVFFDEIVNLKVHGFRVLEDLPNIAVRDFWNLGGSLSQIKNYLILEQTQLFGPVDDLYGEEQYRRCIRSYELIKKHGYVPEKFFDGYISGFLIKRDDDYRFCVTSGKHRIGALSVLGEDRIKIRTDSDLKILDLSSLRKVPVVSSGLINIELAKILLDRYFDETGYSRAKFWGLI